MLVVHMIFGGHPQISQLCHWKRLGEASTSLTCKMQSFPALQNETGLIYIHTMSNNRQSFLKNRGWPLPWAVCTALTHLGIVSMAEAGLDLGVTAEGG